MRQTHQDNNESDIQHKEKDVGTVPIDWNMPTVSTSRRLRKVRNGEEKNEILIAAIGAGETHCKRLHKP